MAGALNAMETGSLGRRGLGGRKYLMEVNMTVSRLSSLSSNSPSSSSSTFKQD